MKKFIGLLLLVFVGVVGWRIGGSLSSDAMSMAVGVLFGVLAGVPTALLWLAAERRRNPADQQRELAWGRDRNAQSAHYLPQGNYPAYPQPAPVIVLTGAPAAGQPSGYALPVQPDRHGLRPEQPWTDERQPERTHRHFKVVGEKEEWVDEW